MTGPPGRNEINIKVLIEREREGVTTVKYKEGSIVKLRLRLTFIIPLCYLNTFIPRI